MNTKYSLPIEDDSSSLSAQRWVCALCVISAFLFPSTTLRYTTEHSTRARNFSLLSATNLTVRMQDGSDSDDGDDLPTMVSANGCSGGLETGLHQVADNGVDDGEEMFVDSLPPAQDLFSSKSFKTPEECLDHCKDVHGLDLSLLKKRHSMDTFSYIRFINYLRTEAPSPGFVMSLSSSDKWSDVKYMKPVIPDDPLLMFNFEDDLESLGEEEEEETGFEIDISRELDDQIANPRNVFGSVPISANSQDDEVRISLEKFSELKLQYESMAKEIQAKDAQLKCVMEDMAKMKSIAQVLVSSGSSEPPGEGGSSVRDSSYFQGYAHYSIHHEMLSDQVRTETYQAALKSSKLAGARVLDIGCGTGILSMFSAQAGASLVVGVDCSEIIYQAMDIIEENNMKPTVQLIKGKLEDIQLPQDQFDIIVSEWMGYFLLYEGMLDTVIKARDKYLAPGGLVLPNRCSLELCAVSDPERYDSYVGKFWSDVYGLKMSCMRLPILEEASVEVIPDSVRVSNTATVLDLDINTCTISDTSFTSSFLLTISRDCELTGICGYFDIFFDLPDLSVMFSTGPHVKPTHWKQTIFFFPEKLPVKENSSLNCSITCKRMKTDARSLKISLTVEDKTFKYLMD